MYKKPTKQEAKKVATAVKRRFWANREDLPYVADKEYFFSGSTTCQEIHWEGGDYEWAIQFAAYYNDAQNEFFVEPYNGFVLCVYKREEVYSKKELVSMGSPSYVAPSGFITWE